MTIGLFQPLTKPTAAQLNAIGASQVAVDAQYIGANVENAVPKQSGDGDYWILRHVHRWLIYTSTGELIDLSGANDAVSLSDGNLFDLNSVSWLATGAFYAVSGCEAAMERREVPSA